MAFLHEQPQFSPEPSPGARAGGGVPAQALLLREARDVRVLQRAAGNAAVGRMIGTPAPGRRLMRHPLLKVLRKAVLWTAKRGADHISKHVAKHGRRVAGKAVHSVFRMERHINFYVSTAIREAEALAAKATKHAADAVLEEGGIKIYRQAGRTPGKFRMIIEKEFAEAIGTKGETILKVVIDASGRVVTAYPMNKLAGIVLGIGAAGTALFDARTADAAELIRDRIEEERQHGDDWLTQLVDFVESPMPAVEDEQLRIDIDNIVHETTLRLIADIEAAEGVCLPDADTEAIRELVSVAIATPMLLEEE